ncbi:MAG TPA: YraN family protein [Casimicrobiaceae bacterium]|nr:YraN family protein [Casimicrobiaceae bacterium]
MARADRAQALASGRDAEARAASYLESQGLHVIARNVRNRFGEIDLVCREGGTLVFVEVRMRRSQRYGGAAESITAAKRARLVAACEGYVATLASTPPCRIDAVLIDGDGREQMQWLHNVVS